MYPIILVLLTQHFFSFPNLGFDCKNVQTIHIYTKLNASGPLGPSNFNVLLKYTIKCLTTLTPDEQNCSYK